MAAKRFPALLLIFILLGCSTDRIDADLTPLDIDFTWPEAQKCFDPRSPVITLSGLPPGVAAFHVRMWDISNMHDHGGGTVPNDNAGTIPMGALTDYQGPCPSWGSPRFQITVEALDQAGAVVAMGKKTRSYPSED